MKIHRTFILILIAGLLFIPTAWAQTGGQFCARSFEDRNGNGTLDGGEPLLTRGVSAELLNADNVIVASALLSSSPTAAQGVICFQFLAPGQYTMIITSPDYLSTTPNTVSAEISDGTLPTVVEFGGQQMNFAPAEVTSPANSPLGIDLETDVLQRVVLSALGTLVVIAGMIVLGSLIYLIFVRRKPAPAYPNPTTGNMPPVVSTTDTDEIKPVT